MLMKAKAEERMLKALDKFNRYQGSEAGAGLVSIDEACPAVRFEDSFCRAYRFHDWMTPGFCWRILVPTLGCKR